MGFNLGFKGLNTLHKNKAVKEVIGIVTRGMYARNTLCSMVFSEESKQWGSS